MVFFGGGGGECFHWILLFSSLLCFGKCRNRLKHLEGSGVFGLYKEELMVPDTRDPKP